MLHVDARDEKQARALCPPTAKSICEKQTTNGVAHHLHPEHGCVSPHHPSHPQHPVVKAVCEKQSTNGVAHHLHPDHGCIAPSHPAHPNTKKP